MLNSPAIMPTMKENFSPMIVSPIEHITPDDQRDGELTAEVRAEGPVEFSPYVIDLVAQIWRDQPLHARVQCSGGR